MGTEIEQKSEEAVPAEAPSSLEQQIIRQIEYYFGNYNLSRDKFLREQLKLDDGWVPLETMVKFNRLKKLSDDFNVIANALKKSPQQLMEVNEDCTKIRRRTAAPVPEDYSKRQEELDKRTLYVKGFKKTNTLDELLEFFKDYKVENIFMRKYNNKNNKPFKGSVFATFETREDAEKFLETKGIKYSGTDLLKEWRTDYMKRKDAEFSKLRSEKEKKILQREQQKAKEEEECIKSAEIIPGCLLKIVNLTEDIMREHILEVFEPLSTVQYIDYSKGKPSAVLRFEEGQAKIVLEKVVKDGETVKIGSCQASISLVEGDEEKAYWQNLAVFRAQRKRMNKDKHRGHRNFPNKKRSFGNRQKRSKEDNDENDKEDESNESPRKKVKAETSEANDVKSESPQKKEKVETSEANDKKVESPKKKEKVETSEANDKKVESRKKKEKAETSEANDKKVEPPQTKQKVETSEVSDKKDETPQKKKKLETSEANDQNNEPPQKKKKVETPESVSGEKNVEPQ